MNAQYPMSCYFSRTKSRRPHWVGPLLDVFFGKESEFKEVLSSHSKQSKSDFVLNAIKAELLELGYDVEKSKMKKDAVIELVPFGRGEDDKIPWEMDARKLTPRIYVEIEAGRAIDNWHIYRDLMRFCVIRGTEYGAIAVPLSYRRSHPYEKALREFKALYLSDFIIPLKGLLLIGY